MLTIGLVVEGIYDEAALKELIQKCARTQVEVIGRPCHGVNRLMQKFPNVLKEFQYVKGGSHVDKALVIRDAGNTAEIARKIAANARVEALESRCQSFKQFQEAILDC